MANVTIKGLPDAVYEQLKQLAASNRRSLNGELIVRLEQSLGLRREAPEAFLARVDRLRERVGAPPLTDELLRDAKQAGRP